MYVYFSNVKYKLKNDFCKATPNYESCFIEIDQEEGKNTIVGVLYRAHTSLDNFIRDISPSFETISNENKTCFIMEIKILIYWKKKSIGLFRIT